MGDRIQTKQPSSRRLKICHISDLHGHHENIQVPECDLLICSGDISMVGRQDEVESFFSWLEEQKQCKRTILTAGNHDLAFDPQRGGNNGHDIPQWLVDIFGEFHLNENNHYLLNESIEIEGVKIWGSPTSAWFHGDRWAFNVREKEAEELYSTIPSGTDIVITHGPAYTYGDWAINCACYVGDHRLAYHIKRVKPLLHLFGHIHESYGYQPTSFGTHFFNGCSCGLDYKVRNQPWLIDVDFDNEEVHVLNQIK